MPKTTPNREEYKGALAELPEWREHNEMTPDDLTYCAKSWLEDSFAGVDVDIITPAQVRALVERFWAGGWADFEAWVTP